MGWPKGKQRKTTETPQESKPEAPQASNKPVGHPVSVIEAWSPSPDMGKVQPPSNEVTKCLNCQHEGGLHYGGPKGWCNKSGCSCQEFKKD